MARRSIARLSNLVTNRRRRVSLGGERIKRTVRRPKKRFP